MSTEITLLSVQMKEILFSKHKKHFVVCAKERNTVLYPKEITLWSSVKERNTSLYAQETLCCLHKKKKHCFLCTRNTFLSVQKNEILFSIETLRSSRQKKHFVVFVVFCAKEKKHWNTLLSAKERNTVFCAITLLSVQKKETLFSMHNTLCKRKSR